MNKGPSSFEESSTGSLSRNEERGYPGTELEAMSEAANYHRWILEIFKPYLGVHLVEVGAGIGSFSELILTEHVCKTLSLVEPSDSMYERLRIHVRQLDSDVTVDMYHATFVEAADLIKSEQAPDSIIYVNVLEHIADDETELSTVRRTLSASGRIFIFVPALQWLFGPFDERVGHLRRYSKSGLEEKLHRCGFKILRSSYFDFAGIAPWWFNYRLLRSVTLDPEAVRFYDQYIIPFVRRIESVVTMPIGKNVIAIAEKR
ncbi:MAG: class I SAM-dependent methyltransferase [Pyrinomonadaceae bacterium]|nr:class I SAM-dependent methyltransferase [Pyrinomonadaceae bacterium]